MGAPIFGCGLTEKDKFAMIKYKTCRTGPFEKGGHMPYTQGYIVQTEDDGERRSEFNYNGPGRKKSWPLQGIDLQTELEAEWIDNYLAQDASSMKLYELIFDDVTLERYVSECKIRGLNIRILYIRDLKFVENTPDADNLDDWGYDLLYVSDPYYSVLNEEFESVKTAGYAHCLNEHGLFTSKEHLFDFIRWRKQHILDNGEEGEPLDEMCAVQVYFVRAECFEIRE